MLPEEQFRSTARITRGQAERLFATPAELGVALTHCKGSEVSVFRHGVKLFTGLQVDERNGERRVFWLQGSGPTPGSDVELVLEELNAKKTGSS